MIYLIDEPLDFKSHSSRLSSVIKEHTDSEITHISVSLKETVGGIYRILNDLIKVVLPTDIVVCAWVMDANYSIDMAFNDLSDCCWVVVSAGNNGKPIDNYTPARAKKVITVGALNKSGIQAKFSNFSNNKAIEWVPGTNYDIDGDMENGTSVATALYAAFLSEAVNARDFSKVDKLINTYKMSIKI
jgi:hypothetical protein